MVRKNVSVNDGAAATDALPASVARLASSLRPTAVDANARQLFLEGGRAADQFYRQRWSHDKIVHSTHGVNCTGSCSWNVYVKNGVITWETQNTDYPTTGPDFPEYEPRGCPRGAAFSWYTYSPTRIKYPYVRGVLLDMYRSSLKRTGDPVLAWRDIVENPEKAKAYKTARGKGGLVRASWEEALDIAAAAHVYTTKRYGPDRMAGFSVIPAMSMISYGAGSRFYELMGGTMLSFYDWYADLPMASPQVFGDQTDVPESGDWFNAAYLIMWGSNIPQTRTPDAHFMTEARYHGQKVVAVSPDYADNTKFADEWLRVAPGTDGALAQAMGHVILKEFHVGRKEPFFLDYMKRFTDAPFLVALEPKDGAYVPGKFVVAGDFDDGAALAAGASLLADPSVVNSENAAFRPLVWDQAKGISDPGGTLADHYGKEGVGKWNLEMKGINPLISAADFGSESAEVLLPRFDLPASADQESIGAGVMHRGVPAVRVGGTLVTTVYDLLLAQYGVERPGLPGRWPSGYDDADEPCTPAWQSQFTSVPPAAAIRIAREFAQTAIDSGGRSMIVMGAGTNHYYHSDTMYRTFLALTSMCATQGVNGGGWAHYVGQEKVRPMTGWAQYAFALDWVRPARQMTSAGFWYLLTDQWRYDGTPAKKLLSPLADGSWEHKSTADTLVEAMKRGWMPTYPTFSRSPLLLAREAKAAGVDPKQWVVDQLNKGILSFACEDPDNPENFPRIMTSWRTNLLGSSAKGAEFFYRYMVGSDSAATAKELPEDRRPEYMVWRDAAASGKVDLLLTLDFRNTSTTLYSDVVLPAATWYEKDDLSSTDMHPFIHAFDAAIAPPWESRTDFQIFQELAARVSRMAVTHLGVQTDVIAVPLGHDSPDELATPHGAVHDVAGTGLIPGKTMPKLVVAERDYTTLIDRFNALGPLPGKVGMATKGVHFDPTPEIRELSALNGTAATGRPLLNTAQKAADMVLRFSGTTNGRLADAGFADLEKRTGERFRDLAAGSTDRRITIHELQERGPQSVITSPEWTGSEHGGRRYSAFVQNIERGRPFHTLTGRQHYYLDHDWMRDLGEALPIFRPPLDLHAMYGEPSPGQLEDGPDGVHVAVRYLTPHHKWAIHSQYFDNIHMLTLGRGGQTVWMSPLDAQKIGVKDNDWIEAWNRNGVVVARAVVSHRMPEGTVFMYHAQERTIGTPLTEATGKRGGIHNSLTRILIKPTHLIGGYAQHSYAFNYVGPTGNQRDEVTFIRKRSQEVTY
jgi:nitrate reductase alpha subunit